MRRTSLRYRAVANMDTVLPEWTAPVGQLGPALRGGGAVAVETPLMDAAFERLDPKFQAVDGDRVRALDLADADERVAFHFGSMVGQVLNGGFQQWMENGYADGESVGFLRRTLTALAGAPEGRPARRPLITLVSMLDVVEFVAEEYGWDLSQAYTEEDFEAARHTLDQLDDRFYPISDALQAAVEEHLWQLSDRRPGPRREEVERDVAAVSACFMRYCSADESEPWVRLMEYIDRSLRHPPATPKETI